MPQWRKLWTKTTESLDINDMPDDFHRLLWTLLPLVACREGRGMDNPAWIKAKAMPLRMDIRPEQVEQAVAWYAGRGMIERYEVGGRRYFQIQNWHRYQGNTDREAESDYPPMPSCNTDVTSNTEVKTSSRPTHDQLTTNSGSDADADAEEIESIGASATPPDCLPNQFELSVPAIQELQLTRPQWEAVLQSEKDADGRKSLIKWVDSKLHGAGHPAIRVYREEMESYPSKNQYGEIIAAVGENGRMDVWRSVVHAWKMHGWNPRNIAGMLDAFRAGGVQDRRSGNKPAQAVGVTNYQDPDEFFAGGVN